MAECGFVLWLSVSLLFPQQAFSFWAFTLVPDQQVNAAEKPV